jgi:putative nucleotidyltransferase with HDIG domain
MKKIYQRLWALAKPYYKKGRPFDMLHIQILLKNAETVCHKEKIDASLLIPLVILHDIGYGTTQPVFFEKNLKKQHMIAGAKLANTILRKINYPKDKIKKIVHWISIHDNWIFGQTTIYKRDKVLAILMT